MGERKGVRKGLGKRSIDAGFEAEKGVLGVEESS